MLGQPRNPVSAYAQIGMETSVQNANPHRLIVLLLEGASTAIAIARIAIDHNDVSARGNSISKAINIINNGLRASLDDDAGGDLAQKLAALYEYMCKRLLIANLRNDKVVLDEVAYLLSEIHEAWVAIAPSDA